MTDDTMERIRAETIARYRNRYQEHGVSARALGWGSRRDQEIRFDAFSGMVDCRELTLLDLGCGFADLLGHLKQAGNAPRQYIGVDLNRDFVDVAAGLYPEARFHCNADGTDWKSYGQIDVTVMLGLVNFKQSAILNLEFAENMIAAAWAHSDRGVVCDFLSANRTPDYAPENWVHYYEPAEVLSLAVRFSNDFALRHDYEPNPQKEMMLWIRKDRP
jgi:SAM-dependent methyltransferase